MCASEGSALTRLDMAERCVSTAEVTSASRLDQLVGQALPAVRLAYFSGSFVDLRGLGGRLVIYFYPGCVCSPEDGYRSPVLDVAQHRAFAFRRADFLELACRPVGISSQSVQDQRLIAADTGARHLLLSDPDLQLARALGLPTFNVDKMDWYCRVLLVVREGIVARAFSPVSSAAGSAAQAITWMRGQGV